MCVCSELCVCVVKCVYSVCVCVCSEVCVIIIIIIIITKQSALLVCSGLHTYNYNNDWSSFLKESVSVSSIRFMGSLFQSFIVL